MSVAIPASELKGKFVEYIDRDWKFRIGRVQRVRGGFVTLRARGEWKKRRVRKDQIRFRVTPKKKQDIDWTK
jgi:hypothetical protein